MLDLMIQMTALTIVGTVGYMAGDASFRTVKCLSGLAASFLKLMLTLLEPKVETENTNEIETANTTSEIEFKDSPVVVKQADLTWVIANAVQWVSDDELIQQSIDEKFTLTFSDFVRFVDYSKMSKFSEFQRVLGGKIEKIKKGYRVSVDGYTEEFKNLKSLGSFLNQLQSA